jgi:lipoate-protein ligase A
MSAEFRLDMMNSFSKWRLLELDKNSASMNMAIDEAILINCSKGKSPNTIRLYEWLPSAVSIGYFQNPKAEVDLEKCKEENVDVVRRITGGGAVFHDTMGEVTYSMVTSEEDRLIPKDILRSYQMICGCVIEGLLSLGVAATFQPVNDIVVAGRKISGNAQTRRLGMVLQHGTILVDADLDKMFQLLKVSDEKIRDKMISSAEQRVTTLKNELSKKPSHEQVAEAIEKGFKKYLGIKLTKGKITDDEMTLAEKLSKEKYANEDWTFRR